MIPLTNYDYSEGEQASVVMKFTQIYRLHQEEQIPEKKIIYSEIQ
jgi:hypothetical protein